MNAFKNWLDANPKLVEGFYQYVREDIETSSHRIKQDMNIKRDTTKRLSTHGFIAVPKLNTTTTMELACSKWVKNGVWFNHESAYTIIYSI